MSRPSEAAGRSVTRVRLDPRAGHDEAMHTPDETRTIPIDLPARPGERKPLGAPCRYCGSADTWVEIRLEGKPLGTFSLAGVQTKTTAGEWPYAVCDGCGHESRGQVVDRSSV